MNQLTVEDYKIINEFGGKKNANDIYKLLPSKNLITLSQLKNKMYDMGIRRNFIEYPNCKYTHNYIFWKEPNLINSFISGCIAADGCIMKFGPNQYALSYKVSIIDECLIDMLIKQLNFTGPKKYTTSTSPSYPDRTTKFVYITIYGFTQNAKFLEKYYNLTPQKTHRLKPTNLNNIELDLSFITGFTDGDGCISLHKSVNREQLSLTYVSCAKEILDWIKNIFDLYFPYNSKYNPEIANVRKIKDKHCYIYTVTGLRAGIIVDYLSQIPLPKLNRKWQKQEIIKYISIKKQQNPHLFIPYGSLKTINPQHLTSISKISNPQETTDNKINLISARN